MMQHGTMLHTVHTLQGRKHKSDFPSQKHAYLGAPPSQWQWSIHSTFRPYGRTTRMPFASIWEVNDRIITGIHCTHMDSWCIPARGSPRQAGWLQTGWRYRITLMKWLGKSRDNVQAHMRLIVGAVLRYRHASDKIPGFSEIPAPPWEWQWSNHKTISAVFSMNCWRSLEP